MHRQHPLVVRLRGELRAAADPARAASMRAYMKSAQPFLGVPAPLRRRIVAAGLRSVEVPRYADYRRIVLALWQGTYREERYAALDVAEALTRYRTPRAWPLYARLVREAGHWDTLDRVAARLAGPLLLQDPDRWSAVERWVGADGLWLRRAALLIHLHHGARTDTERLARTDPRWVRAFVAAHGDRLSALSRREALRHLGAAAR